MNAMSRTELKAGWREVDHPSGKYWYHKRTKETTRDMPLAQPPSIATACIVEQDDQASAFQFCNHCKSTIIPEERYTALTPGQSWLKKRCCPLCDGLLEYVAVCQPTSSTRLPAGKAIARQESFARRLARKAIPSLSSDSKRAKEEDEGAPKQAAPAVKAELAMTSSTKSAAEEGSGLAAEEGSTSSTRSMRRLSLKRERLDNSVAQDAATAMKSPRLKSGDDAAPSDQIQMVVGMKMNGVTSGPTAKFIVEPEVV